MGYHVILLIVIVPLLICFCSVIVYFIFYGFVVVAER